jgi:ATP-dependent DNA helicase RecG
MSAAATQENDSAVPPRSRPEVLFPIFAPVTALKGVGPRIGKHIERLVGEQVVDLLWHLPTALIDRRYSPKLADLEPGRVAGKQSPDSLSHRLFG